MKNQPTRKTYMKIDEISGYRPYIPRPVYSQKVKPFVRKEIIKVIIGLLVEHE